MLGVLFLIVFVYAFGHYGERLTQGIDLACSDAAFEWGKRHETLGNVDQAVRYYRQGLAGHFRSESKKNLCVISLGNLLCREKRYQEAIEAYARLPEDAFDRAGSLTGYVSSLQSSEKFKEAERLGKIWLQKAESEQDALQMLWANTALGRICQDTGRLELALDYYKKAIAVDPASYAGIHAAQVLNLLGNKEEAFDELDSLLSHIHSGQLYEDATKVRNEIAATINK